jgi:hypothetical protein
MDQFDATLGPTSNRRAANVALNPYGATKYFFFIINTVLRTLFGIDATKDNVLSKPGILGVLNAYFSVVEAQG